MWQTQDDARVTPGLIAAHAGTQNCALDLGSGQTFTDNSSEPFAPGLPCSGNAGSNCPDRGARNKFKRGNVGAHPPFRFQHELLARPIPTGNAPRTRTSFSPTGKNQSPMSDVKIEFFLIESQRRTSVLRKKPFAVRI